MWCIADVPSPTGHVRKTYLRKSLFEFIFLLSPSEGDRAKKIWFSLEFLFFWRAPSETARQQFTTIVLLLLLLLLLLLRTSNGLVRTNTALLSLVDTHRVQYTRMYQAATNDMSRIVPSPQNVLIQTAVITTHLQYLLYSPTLPLTPCTILPYSPPDLPCHLPYSKPPLTHT